MHGHLTVAITPDGTARNQEPQKGFFFIVTTNEQATTLDVITRLQTKAHPDLSIPGILRTLTVILSDPAETEISVLMSDDSDHLNPDAVLAAYVPHMILCKPNSPAYTLLDKSDHWKVYVKDEFPVAVAIPSSLEVGPVDGHAPLHIPTFSFFVDLVKKIDVGELV